MRTISFILAIILFGFGFTTNKTKVKITNKSEVIIKGKSNVNSFSCKYNSDLIEDVFYIVVSKQNTKTTLIGAEILIKSNGFDCAHRMITKDFKTILKAEDYPHIKIAVNEIVASNNALTAKVKVEIAGIAKDYIIPIVFDQKSNNVKGELKLNIKDFKLKSPKKLLGMVVVDDNVDIQFNLFLQY